MRLRRRALRASTSKVSALGTSSTRTGEISPGATFSTSIGTGCTTSPWLRMASRTPAHRGRTSGTRPDSSRLTGEPKRPIRGDSAASASGVGGLPRSSAWSAERRESMRKSTQRRGGNGAGVPPGGAPGWNDRLRSTCAATKTSATQTLEAEAAGVTRVWGLPPIRSIARAVPSLAAE